ncbi:Stk1 family PASTA domain-containing Ser/Thr kinase [Lentzea sp. NBC_00516]|uniref:Stk1 family PASTA domain-containing Ser/Thr kinase n=1 Tax=Lentzea sp. NBC_00516 TaxID=2903582 RepID=UPI002E81A0F9|nr:Stk1 family PASTA domain-containing Ser/Thr kinase [Lentzea sp. NBC_00516]WUD20850.1 Stk1 family PASTA domain-containing Ser/Thr kinase [Lentzea sp. NBC_00516]
MERSVSNVMGGLLEQRYRVDSVLARGGMSTVYRGRDTRLDRDVAIKVMDPHLTADPAFVARFEREARAAAQLHHPAVVSVHDQGVDGDQVYLVMELIDGGNLRDLLNQRGKLAPAVALSVLGPVLSALGAAHRAGLVHRDVKPENVLIGPGGQVKVADFGLARAIAENGVTSDSEILGTVAYLSPEQVESGSANARSDVYAAGIVLYEMLAGQAPYRGETPISVAYQHVNSDVPSVPEIPLALDTLVRKATRRDPVLRPANADAFLAELERVGTDLGLTPQPVPVPGSAPENDRTVIMRPVPVAVGATPPSAAELTRPVVPKPSLNSAAMTTVSTGPPPTPPPGIPVGNSATRTMQRPEPPRRRPPQKRKPKVDPVEEERKRRKKLFTIWGSVAAVVVVLVGLFTWYVSANRYTEMPSVAGQSEQNAMVLLSNADLTGLVEKVPSNDVPNGTVISSDPGPGAELRKNQQVKLVVSRGRPVVPFITTGVDEAAATKEIQAAGLKTAKDPTKDAFHDTVPIGKVVGVDPRPGTALDLDAPVTLILSKGPPPRLPVPNVAGKTKDEATAELQRAGLEAVDAGGEDAPENNGSRVVRTDPPAGTVLDPTQNKRVTLFYQNNQEIEVPDVTRQKVREAKEQLERAGLKVKVEFNKSNNATVVNQSIPPRTRVKRGTEITIVGL